MRSFSGRVVNMALLYLAVVLVVLFGIYISLCWQSVAAKQKIAFLLLEILQATEWADIMQMLKSDDYVEAVLQGCEIMLEG